MKYGIFLQTCIPEYIGVRDSSSWMTRLKEHLIFLISKKLAPFKSWNPSIFFENNMISGKTHEY